MILRQPESCECEDLTRLCFRSKAHWGYDSAFMQACKDELKVTQTTLQLSEVVVAERSGVLCGLAQLDLAPPSAVLEKLFVNPEAMGTGVGKCLFQWAVEKARELRLRHFIIDGDPNAVPFYLHMGAVHIGSSPSGSIPGRRLPVFQYDIGQID